MNKKLTVKLTPKDDSPSYSQSQPTPVNMKEDILVELVLSHKYGTIRTLPFSKYSSHNIAQENAIAKQTTGRPEEKTNFILDD